VVARSPRQSLRRPESSNNDVAFHHSLLTSPRSSTIAAGAEAPKPSRRILQQ
jgi:hypothetical protein